MEIKKLFTNRPSFIVKKIDNIILLKSHLHSVIVTVHNYIYF